MKKGMIFTTVVMVLAVCGVGRAQGDLGVTIDGTWVSKYIWRGFDRLDDKAAFQPSVMLDLFNTGFNVGVWGSWAGASGSRISTVDATELNYIAGYNGSLCGGDAMQVDYALTYIYYDFIDQPSRNADTHEISLSIALPQITGIGLVPRYTAAYLWDARSGGPARDVTGWIHEFGLDYNLIVGEIIPNNPEQIFTFSWDITYNDGAGAINTAPGRGRVDHDWSHMTWGVKTEICLPWGTFTPGLYYQTSMEDTVNTQDEFWTGLSYTLKF
ncbi:MAG: hypothetical protein IH624_08215 [Phycisphaerae bacterium]|nr:hypothetical protein [Phycisphaerae bacterium]